MEPTDILKRYFGYDSFRGGQESLIDAILSGRDVLGIMPTGAGKSICFQVPALIHEGLTIVISPLISLMKDQVGALGQAGISAAYINSTLTAKQVDMALYRAEQGTYKLLYVAPERLLTPSFLAFAHSVDISMVAVDEAHCISQWGQDFRPSYSQIPTFIASLSKRPVVAAFTATATTTVKTDIINILALEEPHVLVTGFDRKNLYFEVQSPKGKLGGLLDFLEKFQEDSGIIYCSTRKAVEEVCTALNERRYHASRYHAGLSDAERHQNQEDFLFDRVPIMVATNAFGMGIDKSNVSFVVHYNMPKDLESYYQEAGRAGRDGAPAHCLLLYSGQDVRTHQWMIENGRDSKELSPQEAQQLMTRERERLKYMTFYATTEDCLRGFILRYFGEHPPATCGHCSNCLGDGQRLDITMDAQKILSCMYRMKTPYARSTVIEVLRGEDNPDFAELGLDKLSTYGICETSVENLSKIIDYLSKKGFLEQAEGDLLEMTPLSRDILFKKHRISMTVDRPKKVASKTKKASSAKDSLSPERAPLYTRLQAVRKSLAQKQGVPAFVVFGDNTLIDMCQALPQTPRELLDIAGVGETKQARYGPAFLEEIVAFCREQAVPIATKKAKKQSVLILPTHKALQEIRISGQSISISMLVAAMNESLKEHGCTVVSTLKLSNFLESTGYLVLEEHADGTASRVPTEQGFAYGITQLQGSNAKGTYMVNQYTPAMQQFLVENLPKILRESAQES